MLNLPEFEVLLKEQNGHFYRFTVEKKDLPYLCTKCGWIKTDFFESDRDMHFKVHQITPKTLSLLESQNPNLNFITAESI